MPTVGEADLERRGGEIGRLQEAHRAVTSNLYKEVDRLRSMNAELVAALEAIVVALGEGQPPTQLAREMTIARAAIARARGGRRE